ncbi:MAG: hypothetical protein ACFFFB_20640 [Candidatus Heimdallarchaeota archaeon]
MRRFLEFILISSLIIGTIAFGNCQLSEEATVDITFEVLTGSGLSDYYVGDYFWYDISLNNTGLLPINTEFRVEVQNPNGTIIGVVSYYQLTLELNETGSLYPNYTRLGKEEVNVYFFETSGTYTIKVSSDVNLNYYKFDREGFYTFTTDSSGYVFDVMPSSERVQNERWSEFLNKNQDYIEKLEIKSQKTTLLTYCTVIIAMISVFIAYGIFHFSWCQLSDIRKECNRRLYRFYSFLFIIIVVLIAIALWLIASMP